MSVEDLIRSGDLPVIASPETVERVEYFMERNRIRYLAHITSPEFRREAYRRIGALLRAERERQGLGLRELARMAGVDASNLSTIERGEMSGRPTLMRALEALERNR